MGKNSLVKHIYICDGVQKNFDYQFESFSKTSIKVFIDNLMIKSGYEIVPFSDKVGGKIIFNTPPLKGKVLSIIRELDFSRSCDFQTGGIFRAEDLNYELNYNIACLNQVNDVLTLAVKLSPLDTKINPVLPKAKAGYAIVWNDTEDGFSNLDVNITEQVRYVEDCTNLVENLYNDLKDKVDFYFDTPVKNVEVLEDGYKIICEKESYECSKCIISVGRSGSKWMEQVCQDLDIPTKSNRVDIGVRVEIPAVIFSHLTDELYESKIVYRTEKFEDNVRTFCMNPHGIVVNENTNGIVTVNGHSYEGSEKQTENTNFALLVAKHFSEPFKDSNGYGESIARLSNMLGGGVIVQRFGDLVRGRRSNSKRIEEGLVTPTLAATPGDLSLVLPKRILDGIIEMIYALDEIAPGTANDDTLLYGVEVKFYNMEVELNEHLESKYKGLYVIGDGSGVTHSLSHASASGVYVAREILNQ